MDYSLAESLHRLVKQVIDSGAAASLEEAETIFAQYRLKIEIDPQWVRDPIQQTVLLTAVALGRRVFLGGVSVVGDLDVPLAVPVVTADNLAGAVEALGARIGDTPTSGRIPVLVIGPQASRRSGFAMRTVIAGWRGGVAPLDSDLDMGTVPGMPLAAMLAAGLAVNEAFLYVSGKQPAIGRRVVGLSLWDPDPCVDWLSAQSDGPPLRYLPSKLWLIGLGHLGQAYLWALGLLPYSSPKNLELVLQDIDIISPSTESTSILSDRSNVGLKKTRAMTAWAETRGFQASIVERTFSPDFRRQAQEPTIALCGLDNAHGRQALDQVGFDLVVEAGLGRGHQDYRTMRLHSLPGTRPAAELWRIRAGTPNANVQPVYLRLQQEGVLDRCGMTLLAGKAVGAPFVGAVAAALAISEILRLLHGGKVHQVIDLDLLALDHRFVSKNSHDFGAFNPGFTDAASRT